MGCLFAGGLQLTALGWLFTHRRLQLALPMDVGFIRKWCMTKDVTVFPGTTRSFMAALGAFIKQRGSKTWRARGRRYVITIIILNDCRRIEGHGTLFYVFYSLSVQHIKVNHLLAVHSSITQ